MIEPQLVSVLSVSKAVRALFKIRKTCHLDTLHLRATVSNEQSQNVTPQYN